MEMGLFNKDLTIFYRIGIGGAFGFVAIERYTVSKEVLNKDLSFEPRIFKEYPEALKYLLGLLK